MVYGYRSTIGYKVNGRVRSITVNSNCWSAIQTVDARNTRPYYIRAVEGDDGYMIPDYNLYIATVAHPITFDEFKRSIETIDGVAGNISCTRESAGTYVTELKYFPFENDLSAKADLSALNTVESSLSNYYVKSETSSATEIQAALNNVSVDLSEYYTKAETSSDAEISAALGLKQDRLTDEQITNASTKCLPLDLSGNTAVSGNYYLDFYCFPRFFAPVVMNGALDVKQLNIVNYEVDSYTSLSAIDEDTIEFVGGFNREHAAVLNLKNDTIAYVSDIEQAVSSYALKTDIPLSVSQLENDANYIDRQALNQALSSKVSKSGDTVQWIGIGRTEQRIAANDQLGFQFSIDDFGSALVKPKANTDVSLDFPGRDGTLATVDDIQEAMSAKADLSALNLALDKLATKAKYRDDTISSFLFIGDTPEVFPNRENVVEVELGLGVSAIGIFTFNGATRLKSVKCNEGMVEIKSGSFNGCTGLSSIKFPSTLTAITGSGATFGRCTSLYDLDFPESLKSISQYCFLDAPISSAVFRGKTAEQV